MMTKTLDSDNTADVVESLNSDIEVINRSKEILREFDKTEISEINQYIATNVPYSILQQVFVLTENPILKAQVFTSVYRILQSCVRYVAHEDTRSKLSRLIADSKDIYANLYAVLSRYQNSRVNFNKHRIVYKIEDFFINQETNIKINKLIDSFLIFAEKQELLDLDKIIGIDLDNDAGKRVLKDVNIEISDSAA